MLFNNLLKLTIEIYLEVLVVIYLNYIARDVHPELYAYEMLSFYISAFGLVLAFILLPISVIYLTLKRPSKEELEDKEGVYWTRLQPLFDELRTNNRWQLSFYLMFVLRRLAFIMVGLLLPSASWTNS